MALFKRLYRIIEEIVNEISWEINVLNIVDNGDGTTTIDVNCTSYLHSCSKFSDGLNMWIVDSFEFNKSLTVKPYGHSNTWTVDRFKLEIPEPKFLHGTVRLANEEYTRILSNNNSPSPIVYLYEATQEKISLRKQDLVNRKADIRLFILINNNFEDFIRLDYDKEVFDPISNVEEKIIKGLLNNRNIDNFTDDIIRYEHEQFAYSDKNGDIQRIFTGELSDLEMIIPLNIKRCNKKDFNC